MASLLRGREHVLGEITRALDDAGVGRGRMVFVTGEPGIGKTALAWEVVRLARERHMDVAWGACLDADLASPFAPWPEIIGPEAAAALVGPGASPSPATDPQEAEWRRFLAFHAVVEQLQSRAAAHGLVVVLEDLHWAGAPSQLLLHYVAAHLGAVGRVVLLGTCRDAELDPAAPLAALVTAVDRLALTPGSSETNRSSEWSSTTWPPRRSPTNRPMQPPTAAGVHLGARAHPSALDSAVHGSRAQPGRRAHRG